MKIFIDWLKKAITKIEHDNELYVGNQFSTKFDVYFFNVGTDTDWFPTLTQLAPTGREAGPFSADSDSFTTTTIDNVTYLTVTFTMGTGYAFIKGVSSFFLYENRITTPNPTKSVIGKFIVTLNKSDNGYFLDDPEFNPKVKEYVDKYSQLRFGGEASTSVIEALETNQGVWLATDTGYYWYWDYDNNEYVRGNLFQAVSVADNGISTAKIQDGAVTENKLASAVKNKINNSVQKGENNPTAASNVHTIISNSNSEEEDVDSSYGSTVDLALDEATVEHSYYSGGTSKYSGIKFDEYRDNTDNEDYARAVIETEYGFDGSESSKITILKDLIELLSDGKITLTSKTGVDITSGDDTNQIEGDINIESKYGDIKIKADSAHTIIIRGCVDFYDDIWAHNSYITGQDIFAERSLYENNKRVATKEYVDQQIGIIDASELTPSDIADNLTTNDSTKVLSAAQGVVLKGFIDSINTLLQCDDTTLDEIQEIVDYIKNNKSLIDGITTSKVNVSDIINNLTSTATNKPLSANQGKVLKDALDGLQTAVNGIKNGTSINSFGAVETALGGKQNVIDSSHKLDADLVSDSTSSNKFVSAYLKSLITTNRQDINLLDGRVTNLENNPTSNVSGTNDGTNWTSITIGNDTYAIPSGSSGGSGDGEALKIIEITPRSRVNMFITNTRYYGILRVIMKASDYNALLQQLNVSEAELLTAFNNATALVQSQYISNLLDSSANMYTCVSLIDHNDLHHEFRPYIKRVIDADIEDFTYLSYIVYPLETTTSVDGYARTEKEAYILRYGVEYPTTATLTITTIGGGNGSSASSGGAYYEIKTSDITFYDENGNQITSNVLDNLRITMSEGQFEALKEKVNPQLTQMGMSALTDINSLLTILNSVFTETSASASNMAWNFIVLASGYCQFWFSAYNQFNLELFLKSLGDGFQTANDNVTYNEYIVANGDEIPMGISATWTLTEYGTSGGSSSSESYYKIVLEDVEQAYQTNDVYLYMLLEKSRMAVVLDGVNQQVGTSLATPQDLINFFDTIKGNSTYYQSLCKLFATICDICIRDNTAVKFDTTDGLSQITSVSATLGAVSIAGSGNDMSVINASSNTATDIKILFTSSSTLTITEQNNQKL